MAAHGDGALVVYNKEKEDVIFSTAGEEPLLPAPARGARPSLSSDREDGTDSTASEGSDAETPSLKSDDFSSHMHVIKSVHAKNQKNNPVAVWKLSSQRINAFAFSPDRRHLAVVSEDGSLRIIDYLQEKYVGIRACLGCSLSRRIYGLPLTYTSAPTDGGRSDLWTSSTRTTAA